MGRAGSLKQTCTCGHVKSKHADAARTNNYRKPCRECECQDFSDSRLAPARNANHG